MYSNTLVYSNNDTYTYSHSKGIGLVMMIIVVYGMIEGLLQGPQMIFLSFIVLKTYLRLYKNEFLVT